MGRRRERFETPRDGRRCILAPLSRLGEQCCPLRRQALQKGRGEEEARALQLEQRLLRQEVLVEGERSSGRVHRRLGGGGDRATSIGVERAEGQPTTVGAKEDGRRAEGHPTTVGAEEDVHAPIDKGSCGR